jgi:hypothetical protein
MGGGVWVDSLAGLLAGRAENKLPQGRKGEDMEEKTLATVEAEARALRDKLKELDEARRSLLDEENRKLGGCLAKIKAVLASAGITSGQITICLDGDGAIGRQRVAGPGAPRGPRAPRDDLDETTEAEISVEGAKVAEDGAVVLACGKRVSPARFAGILLRDKRAKNKELLAVGLRQTQINGARNAANGTGGRQIPAR